mgnify:CR=1 FL=1
MKTNIQSKVNLIALAQVAILLDKENIDFTSQSELVNESIKRLAEVVRNSELISHPQKMDLDWALETLMTYGIRFKRANIRETRKPKKFDLKINNQNEEVVSKDEVKNVMKQIREESDGQG